MSKYKKGDVVYQGETPMTVAEVIDTPSLPVYRYRFEPPHDGFVCACNSFSEVPGGPTGGMLADLKQNIEETEAVVKTIVNSVASAKQVIIEGPELGSNVFFQPDFEFVHWLTDYADGRMIMDVGCGQGHLLNMLDRTGAKKIGIEPFFDLATCLKAQSFSGRLMEPNRILPWTVERAENLIQGSKENILLVFARPCHSHFVEKGLDIMIEGQEALYITLPENLNLYDDLGKYRSQAVLLEHKGSSKDGEVVYSIKK